VTRQLSTFLPLLALLAGCGNTDTTNGPPLDRFYFPMGIAHVDVPGKTEGVLFVANANADKRYGTGSLVAVALDNVGLPPIGATTSTVQKITALNVDPSQAVQIASFSGELAVQPTGAGEYRLYVPTRSEGMNIFQTTATIDANGTPSLACVGGSTQNCTATGTSLTPRVFVGVDAGVQWPLTPYGVAAATRTCTAATDCCAAGATECTRTCVASQCVGNDGKPFADVWVGYAPRADSGNLLNSQPLTGHLARLDSDDFTLKDENLIPIGSGAANSVAVSGPWVYVSGRIISPAPNLMRLVNRDKVVLSTALESFFRVSDARSIAVSSDGKRLFLVGRAPDTLLIVNIDNPTGFPTLNFVRGVTLPDAPNDVKVIARPGQGDLVAVSCTAAGSVVLYDDEVGDLVSYIGGVGSQPYGLAVDVRPTSARIYVSSYGDGRIGVIDVPELSRPQDARLVAHLGEQQVCLTRGETSPGCLASKEGPQ
jgi:DNA-binding beta-propeller fold protein YncE